MMHRRNFLGTLASGAAALSLSPPRSDAAPVGPGVVVKPTDGEENLLEYVDRVAGTFNATLYKQILGAANEFKEGDAIIGVAAADEASRQRARNLVGNTPIGDIDRHSLVDDTLSELLRQTTHEVRAPDLTEMTVGALKRYLLEHDQDTIKRIMPGLSSSAIGCVVKLMTNQELISVGAKIFNPLPGSQIGAKGYLGARIQPNSPTDNVDDIRWQVFNAWAYAVGDVVVGNNPVSSTPESVLAIQQTLKDLLVTFGIDDVMPHCVLSHIDVQAQVEQQHPDSTALWFQSIAGSDDANRTFDISTDKMLQYAAMRTGKFGLYFETGQGADFTNGHGHGFDMVLHESRKYGFARALTQQIANARSDSDGESQPWVHLNDVAGFIGPEVFRTRAQLVRCCLEDIVMGKLHGLCLGLDVCSTLHMDVSLDDLDWCLDQILPANPAYLMALPTKIDPMLGYLTTGYQDHVRLREKFGYKVNDAMWKFYQDLEVIDENGRPTEHFGDPLWVYLKYRRLNGDTRSDSAIIADGNSQVEAIRGRGVFVTEGHGQRPWDLSPQTDREIRRIYSDAKQCIWAELPPDFIAQIPNSKPIKTQSIDRLDYILHPESGERLAPATYASLEALRLEYDDRVNTQIVISDGLNALSITDEGHLVPFLDRLRQQLARNGFVPSTENIVITSGRVRAGYRIGETLFRDRTDRSSILHIIGERPGTGHHTFSVYITSPLASVWAQQGKVDHNVTKVVSGIATTALAPKDAADETVRLLRSLDDRREN